MPGPDMLNPAKYLTLTFSFVWIVIVANIGDVFIKQWPVREKNLEEVL